jgi:hypothetical protein
VHLTPPPAVAAPLARAMVRTPVPAAALAVAAPALVALARGHHDLTLAITFLAVAAGAALGLAIDDPAGATLDACATTRTARRGARGALVGLALAAAGLVVALAADATAAQVGPVRDRLPEVAAAAAVSVAAAARAARRGAAAPGLPAALGTILAMATSTGLAGASNRWAWLPQVAQPHHAARWWAVAAVAGACAVWWARDPAAR